METGEGREVADNFKFDRSVWSEGEPLPPLVGDATPADPPVPATPGLGRGRAFLAVAFIASAVAFVVTALDTAEPIYLENALLGIGTAALLWALVLTKAIWRVRT